MHDPLGDGVYTLPPRDQMDEHARRLRDTYAIRPTDRLIRREFGYYSLQAWEAQGLSLEEPLAQQFMYDPPGYHALGGLGWCEAAFEPVFETKVIEDRGDYELEQDHAGRHVLYFKGRRDGFMPEYVAHPVQDQATWERHVVWRMDPTSPARYADLEPRMAAARDAARRGLMISQRVIGGYMYLRSLIGPELLLYAFHDQPDLVHACMQAWLALADAVIAKHQEHVTLDELFLAEDICYNGGSLISPRMMRTFLLPYYQQLIDNIRRRQLDPTRHLYIQIDTDGNALPVIPLYQEIGMDAMSPFEVAAGCDVVEVGQRYPELAIFGGIDKRVLAQGRAAIDAHLERIIPAMRQRGGYIPTCDHGVPAEVPLEDYRYYRQRCIELGG